MINIDLDNIPWSIKKWEPGDVSHLEWKRGTIKVWPRQRAVCYKELIGCMFNIKDASLKSSFYRKWLKLSVPCDIAKFINEKLGNKEFIPNKKEDE